ncbi:MAG TPA: TetR/AcrR family transcriptional regulator [Baekduia sp.]|nr:TetR/AcrR family transcriptional regulator [Baekduia sp.]
MSRSTDSRDRMIASAALLLREQGLTGTSFGDVIEHSGAPRGSIYHHFPGGKAQLVEEAVRFAGRYVERLIAQAGDDPLEALRLFLATWRDTLQEGEFRAGCPVVAVAVEAQDEHPQLAEAAAAAFAAWQDALAGMLRRRGVDAAEARRLATMTVAAVEGAVVLCRAQRSTRPLDDVGAVLADLLGGAAG